MFQLDRSTFKKQSFKSSASQTEYWLSKTVAERLQAALYLQSVAYGFDLNNLPRMDKKAFRVRKHEQ